MKTSENWYIRGKSGCEELIKQEFIRRGALIDVNMYDFSLECNIYFMTDGIVFCRWCESDAGRHIVKNWKEVKVTKPQFKPFDKVLVCQGEKDSRWVATFFSFYDENVEYPYFTVGLSRYKYCIPYEGNEHLNGVKFITGYNLIKKYVVE